MANEPATILIVDDNATNRFLLYRGLQQLGHAGVVAEHGREALEKLRTVRIDAILLDLMMPELSGFEVLRILKNDTDLRDIPVIVISGEHDTESVAQSIELGAEDFLPKPFNPIILRARLNASLEKKRYRDLERAYLEQEVMLRQSERIAALARLSAGMAHELHNSVSAAQRSVTRIPHLLREVRGHQQSESLKDLHTQHNESWRDWDRLAAQKASQPLSLSPLERSDRELHLRDLLDDLGIERSWDYAVALADAGWTRSELDELTSVVGRAAAADIIPWVSGTTGLHQIVSEIQQSLGRISSIVEALKAYSYMDQAPYQAIDIRDALTNAIRVLETSMPADIEIRCEFTQDVTVIEGFGSELSMVWTNIIENAVDAMDGAGTLTIRTYQENDWLVIEFHDTGAGIPNEIQSRIFDPFLTTKPPGEGAGLGLSVSHTVIVQKHGGRISATSEPGDTTVEVRLPLCSPDS